MEIEIWGELFFFFKKNSCSTEKQHTLLKDTNDCFFCPY